MTKLRLKCAGLAGAALMTAQTHAALTLNGNSFDAATNPNGVVASQTGILSVSNTLVTAISAVGGSGNSGTVYSVVRDTNLISPGNQSKEVGPLTASYEVTYNPVNGTGTAQTLYVGDYFTGKWAQATELKLYSLLAAESWSWDISGWNGRDAINIRDMTSSIQGITVIEIYGTVVPEPSTYVAAALLALPVLGQLRRTRKDS